jgi:transglutaminase-like putative cysteine protease
MNTRFASVLVLLLGSACIGTPHEEPVDTSRPHRTFRFVYRAAVENVPADARQVRLWVPLPETTRDQEVENVSITVGGQAPDAARKEHGIELVQSEIRHGRGRSLCATSPGNPIALEVSYDVTRFETTGGGKAKASELETELSADSLIPLDGKVAAMAASLPTEDDTLQTARELYDHTLERMRYDKPPGEGWGRGDAEWACDSRFGNCTDFHSYFMGLARSKQIPARFEMGFSVPGGDDVEATIGGYHCWAFFWDDDRGWVPVDISEADKHPEKAEYFFGSLDADRVTMSGGRDVVLSPAPAQGPLNFFVYPYAEVDGQAWSDVTKTFSRLRVDAPATR